MYILRLISNLFEDYILNFPPFLYVNKEINNIFTKSETVASCQKKLEPSLAELIFV